MIRVLVAFLVVGVACGGDDDGGGGQADGSPADVDADDGDDDAAPAGPCTAIDVVFAIDGSGSMADERQALRDGFFPDFASALLDVGEGIDDFRVAVLDACPDPANYHTRGAIDADCSFQSEEVWMDSASTLLTTEFACVGDIYLGDENCDVGDDEQPASSAATSLEAPAATGPNQGFHREDALLVVVAMTDEDEAPTGAAQTAQQIHDRLVTAGGAGTVMVAMGAGATCASQSTLLQAVSDLFSAEDRGIFVDLCDVPLDDHVTEIATVIDQACDEGP